MRNSITTSKFIGEFKRIGRIVSDEEKMLQQKEEILFQQKQKEPQSITVGIQSK